MMMPKLLSIEPDSGPETGGTNLTIIGHGLGAGAEDIVNVIVVQEICAPFVWHNSSVITCSTGPKKDGGKGSVIVSTHSSGDIEGDVKFTYNYAPHIVSIEPRSGPIAGSTRVVIGGRFFGEDKNDVVRVSLAGTPCHHFEWHDSKSIVCVSAVQKEQSSVTGPVIIETRTGGIGRSDRSEEDHVFWSYNPTPLVRQTSPNNGPFHGGTEITIYGESLGTHAEDIERILVAGVRCSDVKYHSESKLSCVTQALTSQDDRKEKQPYSSFVIVYTKSGGSGDKYHSHPYPRYNANFTYNPPPMIVYISPSWAFCTLPTHVMIGGRFLGQGINDIVDVQLAGISCVRSLVYTSPSWIRCNTPVVSAPVKGGITVITKSGGSSQTDISFTFRPQCNLYRSASMCQQARCTWCRATTTCVDDVESCPAVCLLNGDKASCTKNHSCSWCESTTSCLDRKDDCPSSCFRQRSESSCMAVAVTDDCEWCDTTATCLYLDPHTQISSCPTNCSVAPGLHFTCGSFILLALFLVLLVLVLFGMWAILYYAKRDEEFAQNIRKFARTFHKRRSDNTDAIPADRIAEVVHEKTPLLGAETGLFSGVNGRDSVSTKNNTRSSQRNWIASSLQDDTVNNPLENRWRGESSRTTLLHALDSTLDDGASIE